MAQITEIIITSLERGDTIETEIEITRCSVSDELYIKQPYYNATVQLALTDVEDLLAGIIKACRGSINWSSYEELLNNVKDLIK
jgi:hypothetical protein